MSVTKSLQIPNRLLNKQRSPPTITTHSHRQYANYDYDFRLLRAPRSLAVAVADALAGADADGAAAGAAAAEASQRPALYGHLRLRAGESRRAGLQSKYSPSRRRIIRIVRTATLSNHSMGPRVSTYRRTTSSPCCRRSTRTGSRAA